MSLQPKFNRIVDRNSLIINGMIWTLPCLGSCQMRTVCLSLGLIAIGPGLSSAATLEKLSLEEMIQKSTEIVRGRMVSSRVEARGSILYTMARISVAERFKGPEASSLEVSIPGGVSGGVRQTFSGAPSPVAGTEYVFFLWNGRSGIRQIIGFSQGMLQLSKDSAGQVTLSREPSTETVLDPKTRRVVADEGLELTLTDLRARVRRVLAAAKE